MARDVLTRAVRGGRGADGGSGGTWGAAILGEFEETVGRWEAVRWAASGVWLSWRERRTGRGLLAPVAAVLWPADRLRRLLVVGVSAAVLLVAASQFVLTVRYVPSTSMQPTLAIDDRVLVDRLTVRFTGADRGDVVLLARQRHGEREVFNIRVLGLPGDTISCVDGALRRNGIAVDEPYLATGSRTNCSPVTVASGTLYVLGDNRESAVDSRSWGPVDEADVVGEVVGRIWPARRASSVH
ncbi:signal peptidase I [Plantactinospora sp. S1510]|uniref:Signal peptidase I n=1 Tax=Plantactinospora alkalitolerans TaxID=2789879 RepID=A0ABS0GVX9_9ACTN|nr:signal peptidase I [Plantactinospora alkalitolerans]